MPARCSAADASRMLHRAWALRWLDALRPDLWAAAHGKPPIDQRVQELLARERQAATRARALLLALLDSENRKRLTEQGIIRIIGSGGTSFELDGDSYVGNVHVLDSLNHVQATYCLHPAMEPDMPVESVLIAQMLALQTDERSTLLAANRIPDWSASPTNHELGTF